MKIENTAMPDMMDCVMRFELDAAAGKLYYHEDWEGGGRQIPGAEAGYRGPQGRRVVGINGKRYTVARIIWYMHHQQDPGELSIIHINGDFKDCRIENLKASDDPRERMQIRSVSSKPRAKSGVRGVYSFKSRGKVRWRVQFVRSIDRKGLSTDMSERYKGRKTFSFGAFDTKEQAIERQQLILRDLGIYPTALQFESHPLLTNPAKDAFGNRLYPACILEA